MSVLVNWSLQNSDVKNYIPHTDEFIVEIFNGKRQVIYSGNKVVGENPTLIQSLSVGEDEIDAGQIDGMVLYLYKPKFNTKQRLLESKKITGTSIYLKANNIKKISYDPQDCEIEKYQTQCVPECTPVNFGSQSPRLKYEVENISVFADNGGVMCPRHEDDYPYQYDTNVIKCDPKYCEY